ncbi:hypothetical protein VKT23_016278 [Stygiomarasmius scandens]|uniref:HET-domain-containing protein n=1 Tax=Marasmiellus scandens TaxID=2682957 RepID=A0ABR1IVB3_9AGAR
MRLLNTATFQLAEFYANTPPYAILSHTWQGEQVVFQDMHDLAIAKRKVGWVKIVNACAYARKYDFEWIWIDSCCINKESSAELSEAINSMYQYYLDAEVCYVFLCDVPGTEDEDPRHAQSAFRRSRWFTRGWTLQELITPSYAVFLDSRWIEIGTKWDLRDLVSAITSIPVSVFEHGSLARFSIAQKMSWAASRETTRPEDQAYCLMGLFGISMSPIYGEGGQKAFMRLQQEIMKISDDRSIFAWIASPEENESRGLLAKSPYEFRVSGDVGASDSGSLGNKSSFSFNNNGLHIHLPLLPVSSNDDSLFLAPLQCQTKRDGLYLSLYLRRMSESGKYIRCFTSELFLTSSVPTLEDPQELVVTESQLFQRAQRSRKECRVKMELLPRAQQYITHVDKYDLKTSVFRRIPDIEGFQLDAAIWHLLCLECKSQTTQSKERLFVSIKQDTSGIARLELFMVPAGVDIYGFVDYLKAKSHPGDGYADRISVHLGDNGEMIFRLHMAGKDAKLEIDYIPQNSRKPISPRVFLSPISRLGFTASKNPGHGLCFHHCFLPGHFQASHSGSEIYISLLSDPSLTDTFCILTYNFSARFNFYKIFIAVGIHGSRVWMGVDAFPSRTSPKPKDILDSYLDGGDRAKVRTRYKNSVSCSVREGTLNVTIAKRRNLGLGSHFIEFKWNQKDKHKRQTWYRSKAEDGNQENEENQDIALLAYTRKHERDTQVYWKNGALNRTTSQEGDTQIYWRNTMLGKGVNHESDVG